MTLCRLILDGLASGAWNMAVDDVSLAAVERGVATLRFYGWSEPTLSLGRFQRIAERESHWASRECPVVRRASGGGAIVHDQELTYSLALPSRFVPAGSPDALYAAAHESLAESLGELGIAAATLHGRDDTAANPPFLCFERRGRHDLVLGGAKIAGSAQRGSRLGRLQHGSVLLARSAAAPSLCGLSEMASVSLGAFDLARVWAPRFARRLGFTLEPAAWTPDESAKARRIAAEKYAAADWTSRR